MDEKLCEQLANELCDWLQSKHGTEHRAVVSAVLTLAATVLAALHPAERIAAAQALSNATMLGIAYLDSQDADSKAAQAAQEAIRKAAA